MSKLFNLKEWLTVADAARHLAIIFGEEVTKADVLRLALDGRLRLSVYFVNGVNARCGKAVHLTEAEWKEWKEAINQRKFSFISAPKLGDGRLLEFEKDSFMGHDRNFIKRRTIKGVWDLPMIGNERRDVEQEYQLLTGGPEVKSRILLGTLVERGGGEMGQLNWTDTGLNADLGLPKDCVLIVRTDALREFELSINGAPAKEEKPLQTTERNTLLTIIAALSDYSDIKHQERGAAGLIAKMTEEIGATVTDDTLRKILAKIPDALEARNK